MPALAEVELGVCPQCGVMQYPPGHDHRRIKSLSPEEATAFWEARRGVYVDASEPR